MKQYQTAFFDMHRSQQALNKFAMTSDARSEAVITLEELIDKIQLAIEEAKQIAEVWNDVTIQVNLQFEQNCF